MKERKDCKIVQDLLPNYIEKLTNEETNKFIEEHLKDCKDCNQTLQNMKKDLQLDNKERDRREIKYIKKFNKKIKLLRNVLIIIVLLFIIVVGRKIFILTSLSNKAKANQNAENYCLKLESYSEGKMTITEAYYKEEKSLVEITSYSQELGVVKQILYKSGEERFSLIDDGKVKKFIEMGDILISPISFTSDFFVENLYTAIFSSLDKVELNGRECYIIRDGNTEKFIDVNTGLALKMIDNQNNRTVDYKYEYGIVKDTDIAKPDITEYVKNN